MKPFELTNLRKVLEPILESSARIIKEKKQYWYPLGFANYGVEEVIEALDTLCSFRTTMWKKTRDFEQMFAAEQRCEDAVMVNSGSSADLLLSFLLTNPSQPLLSKGDEILIPVVTWPTQIWSAMMAGLKVRFVDVDPSTLNIDVDDLEQKLSPTTKAIFLVHLMGNPCPMDRILEIAKTHNLLILEDCCEALGAEWDGIRVGNFGLGGSFSFFFSHHLTTMEGGMITCPNSAVRDHLRVLRAHGWMRNVDSSHHNIDGYDGDSRYAFVNWGFNVRPTEIQAAFGLHQLGKLSTFSKHREKLATRFFSFIDRTQVFSRPRVESLAKPSWFGLPLLVKETAPFSRNEIVNYLEAEGVETRSILAGNVLRQPVARFFDEFPNVPFPGGDAVHNRGFYIGLSPLMPGKIMDRLIETFENFISQHA